MAKIKGPLHSDSAHGAFGKSMIFRKGKKGTTLTGYYKPGSVNSFTPSIAQIELRTNYGQAVEAWRALTTEQKAVYDKRVLDEGLRMSGWNLFMKEFVPAPAGIEWSEVALYDTWLACNALLSTTYVGWRFPTVAELTDALLQQFVADPPTMSGFNTDDFFWSSERGGEDQVRGVLWQAGTIHTSWWNDYEDVWPVRFVRDL